MKKVIALLFSHALVPYFPGFGITPEMRSEPKGEQPLVLFCGGGVIGGSHLPVMSFIVIRKEMGV